MVVIAGGGVDRVGRPAFGPSSPSSMSDPQPPALGGREPEASGALLSTRWGGSWEPRHCGGTRGRDVYCAAAWGAAPLAVAIGLLLSPASLRPSLEPVCLFVLQTRALRAADFEKGLVRNADPEPLESQIAEGPYRGQQNLRSSRLSL